MNSDLASAHICIDEEGNEYICVSKGEGAGKKRAWRNSINSIIIIHGLMLKIVFVQELSNNTSKYVLSYDQTF